MKYVITGSAGHISKPLALRLLKAGHTVTVIGRNESHLQELVNAGAKTAIGSVEDVDFLKKAFAGADAVYTMEPPNFTTNDLKGYYERMGKNYAAAIKANNIKYVVNLSSMGAHLEKGAGPVSGIYRTEQALNTLQDVNIKHLRPAYFYYNLLSNIDLIKHMGIMGSNFSAAPGRFPIADPSDIAVVAAQELLDLTFTGHSYRYIASDEVGTDDIARAIGKAIDHPDLKWTTFSNDQALQGMLQAGLSQELASNFVDMGSAMHSGAMMEDYWKHRPAQLGAFKLNDFAKVFAEAYQHEPVTH